MSNRNLKREPIHLDDLTWYYEEPKGLVIMHEVHCDDCKTVACHQHLIPWRKIKAALARKEKK